MRGLPSVSCDRGLEALAPLDVIAEHVEARARGRQQDRIAGPRPRNRARHGDLEHRCEFDCRCRTRQRGRYRGCVTTDEDDRTAMRFDGGLEQRELLTLAVATGD